MRPGDIVSVNRADNNGRITLCGLIVEPYREVRGAWYVEIVTRGGKGFNKLAYWGHQLTVLEEAE